MADSNFKFNLDAVLNLKAGDTSEIEAALKKLKSTVDMEAVGLKAAQSSAIKTQVDAFQGVMTSVSKIITNSLPRGGTSKVDSAAASITKIVDALSSVPAALGGSASRSINTSATNIQKLVGILEKLPETVGGVASSVNSLKKAANSLKASADNAGESTRKVRSGGSRGGANVPPPPGSGGSGGAGGGGGRDWANELEASCQKVSASLKGLAGAVDTIQQAISAHAASIKASASNVSAIAAAGAGPQHAAHSSAPPPDPFSYSSSNVRETAAKLRRREKNKAVPGEIKDTDLTELITALHKLIASAVSGPRAQFTTVLEIMRSKLPDGLKAYADRLEAVFTSVNSTVRERRNAFSDLRKKVKKDVRSELGSQFSNDKFNQAWVALDRSVSLSLAEALLDKVREAQRAVDAALASGAPTNKVERLKGNLIEATTDLAEGVRRGAFDKAGQLKRGGKNPYVDEGGVPLPGLEGLNAATGRGLSKVGQEWKNWLETIVNGTDKEFENLRKHFKVSATDRVKAAQEIYGKEVKRGDLSSARDISAVSGMIIEAGPNEFKVAAQLRGFFERALTQATEGRIPTKLTPAAQQKQIVNLAGTGGATRAAAMAVGGGLFKNEGGQVVKRDFSDLEGITKRIYSSLARYKLPIVEMDEAISAVIQNLKSVKGLDLFDEGQINRLVTSFRLLQRERAASAAVREEKAQPATVYGMSAFSGLSSEVLKALQGVNGLKTPTEIVRKIFGGLRGNAAEARKQVQELEIEMARASKHHIELGIDPEQLRAGLTAARQVRTAVEKGTTPLGATREQSFSHFGRVVAEHRAKMESQLAAGTNIRPTTFDFHVPDEATGQLKKLTTTINTTRDSYGKLKVTAQAANATMASRVDLTTALRRVALWGAASGLLYGSLSILRSGLSTITTVETGVIKVGKVIQRSIADFAAFRQEVLNTANTITSTFGTSIESVLETMFTFAQQGLELPDVSSASRVTALAENVTSLDAPKAAEALTAAFQQFGFEVSQSERILDSWNEVANKTAVTETVLAEATKKAGTAARGAGVDFDSFNGLVSAIGSATRQTGKEIGTSLRFIFQRLTRPAAGTALKQIGVEAQDAAGNFRGFLPIIKDLSTKWGDLSQSQKLAVAQATAGIRQYNTFLVVMEKYDEFVKAAAISSASQGSAMRENQEVMKSAVKQWGLFKEQVKQSAVQLGSVFLPVAKLVLGSVTSLATSFNTLPTALKAAVGGMALFGVASLKVGERLDHILMSLSTLPGQGAGLFAALTGSIRSIGAGRSLESLSDTARQLVEANPLRRVSVQVGDFSKNAIKAMWDTSGATAGTVAAFSALGSTGIHSTSELSKFSLAVRAVDSSTGKAALNVSDMNSLLGKLGLTIARVGQSFAGFGLVAVTAIASVIPGIKNMTERMTLAQGAAAVAQKGFWASFIGFAGLTAAVVGGFYALSRAYSSITETGIEAADKMKQPIAKMEEQLSIAKKAALELKAYETAQLRLNAAQSKTPQDVEKDKARGKHVPPELQALKLAASQSDAVVSLGSGAVDAVVGFDKLGNAVLRADTSLGGFNNSAVRAIALSIALKKAQQAGHLASELTGSTFFQSARLVEKYNIAVGRLRSGLSAYASATKSLPDIGAVSSSQGMKAFRKAIAATSVEATKYGAQLKVVEYRLESLMGTLDKDTPAEFFQTLGDTKEGPKILAALADIANKTLTPALGKAATGVDVLNQLLLKTKTGLKDIGPIGEVTLKRFESKKISALPISKTNVTALRDEIKKGNADFNNAIVTFKMPGKNTLEQGRLLLDKESQLIVERLNKAGQLVRDRVSDLLNSVTDVKVTPVNRLSRVVGEEIDRVKTIVTGAGAGTAFTGQINLGARLDLDLTPQQRVARELPKLFQQAAKAQREYNTALKSFNEITKNATEATPGLSANLRAKAAELNTTSFILRLATDLQQLGQAAEKAAYAIETASIGRSVDDFLASFRVGADKGIVASRAFKPTPTAGELTTDQKFNRDFGKQIDKMAADTDTSKAQAVQLKATQRLSADIPLLFKQFKSSLGKTGAPSDIVSLVHNIQSSTDAKSALEKTFQSKAFTQRQSQVLLAAQTLDATNKVGSEVGRLATAMGAPAKKEVLSTRDAAQQQQLQKQVASASAQALKDGFTAYAISRRPKEASQGEKFLKPDRMAASIAKGVTDPISRMIAEAVNKGDTSDQTINKIVQAYRNLTSSELKATTTSINALYDYAARIGETSPDMMSAITARQGKEALAERLRLEEKFASSSDAPATIKKAIEAAIAVKKNAPAATVDTTKVANFGKALDLAEKSILRQYGASKDRLSAEAGATKSLISFKQEVSSSLYAVSAFAHKIGEATRNIKSQLAGKDVDRKLSGPLAGAMRGLLTSSPDIGKSKEDLSPIERLQKTFGTIFQTVEDFQSTIRPESLRVLKSLGLEITKGEERLATIRQNKTEEGVRASLAIGGALDAEKDIRDKLIRVIQSSNVEIGKFAEQARRLVILEDAKKKIEGLVASLEVASRIRFDTTSIDKALGRSPFSIQPAQFGQKTADLDKFQQREEQLKTQLAQGVTADQYRNIQNELKKLEFDKKEVGITEQQGKEREKLSAEINAGKQALQTLAEAERRGAPVGNLIEVIKSEMATAGDVFETGGKKYFRGLPSLQNLSGELTKIQEGNTKAALENQRKITLGPLEDLTKFSNAKLEEIAKNTAAFNSFVDKQALAKKEVAAQIDAAGPTSGERSPDAQQLSDVYKKVLGKDFEKLLGEGSAPSDVVVGFTGKLSSATDVVQVFADSLLKVATRDDTAANKFVDALTSGKDESKLFASGGAVFGPGGVDQVPAMLTAGEFVLPKNAVRSLSSSFGNSVLTSLQRGRLPHFATGGRVKRRKDLELLATSLGIDSSELAPGEGVAGTRSLGTYSTNGAPALPPGAGLLSSDYSGQLGSVEFAGDALKGANKKAIYDFDGSPVKGKLFVGVTKDGRLSFSDSEDSSNFDSSIAAVAPKSLTGLTPDKAKDGTSLGDVYKSTMGDYKAYQEGVRKGYSTLEEYRAGKKFADESYNGEQVQFVAGLERLDRHDQQRAAIAALKGEYDKKAADEKRPPPPAIDAAKVRKTVTEQGIAAAWAIRDEGDSLLNDIATLREQYSGKVSGREMNPLLRGIYEKQVAAGTLASSIILPSHGETEGAFVSLGGVQYKVPYKLAKYIKGSLEEIQKRIRAAHGAKESFEDSPILSRLATANDPGALGFLGSLGKRVVGTVGLGAKGALNTMSDDWAKRKVDPNSIGAALESFYSGAKSTITAPFQAVGATITGAVKTAKEFDFSSREGALKTLTNAGITGLSALGAYGGLKPLVSMGSKAPVVSAVTAGESVGTTTGSPTRVAALAEGMADMRLKWKNARWWHEQYVAQGGPSPGAPVGASSSWVDTIGKTAKLTPPLSKPQGVLKALQALEGKSSRLGPKDMELGAITLPKSVDRMIDWLAGIGRRKKGPLEGANTQVDVNPAGARAGLIKANSSVEARNAALMHEARLEGSTWYRGATGVYKRVTPETHYVDARGVHRSYADAIRQRYLAGQPQLPAAPQQLPPTVVPRPPTASLRSPPAPTPPAASALAELNRRANTENLTNYMLSDRWQASAAADALRMSFKELMLSPIFEKARRAADIARHGVAYQGFATGGHIFGPGGPTSDTVPIMASPGEYVVRASAAKSLGLARLEYMNSVGKLPRFREGGPVGGGSSDGFSVDTESISSAIASALDEAAARFADKLSSIELLIKAPSAEELTLRVPDLPELRASGAGGPGAARLDAVEGSVDALREELQGIKSKSSVDEEASVSSADVRQLVEGALFTAKSESLTELNERISNVLNDLKAELDGRLASQLAEVRSEVSSVESIARQASSAASDALSRSMRQ